MSGAGRWTLSFESEAAYLIPWLDTNPPPEIVDAVEAFIYGPLLDWPWVDGAEDDGRGVFGVEVEGVPIVWVLDLDQHTVHLAVLGIPS